ncbi:hypothetical protein MPTK1_4g08950 [Marchantia polymorpha subsp. ruderalis]|uniref:Uncharacterized protein n=2 Tax=Marchantia polymorpha TaxID=3197 RepID=A0AAF6B7X5_MARPO|nr:hypothetical protein MARPO_0188s0016 [Marchantia polymorpha]BBN08109.1 hypothetical protein Mp_4g08950 [Marchantia polymorpha subsp. ruderalis]|eukprot:PTQ27671.1 hypothetical protein MARPO_0188s0016 [Marchantia polymorpha]
MFVPTNVKVEYWCKRSTLVQRVKCESFYSRGTGIETLRRSTPSQDRFMSVEFVSKKSVATLSRLVVQFG